MHGFLSLSLQWNRLFTNDQINRSDWFLFIMTYQLATSLLCLVVVLLLTLTQLEGINFRQHKPGKESMQSIEFQAFARNNVRPVFHLMSSSIKTKGFKRKANLVCSSECLRSILQECEESVKPAIVNESISKRFCGLACGILVASYARACNYTHFSVNVTGTCLVSSHPQCIFAVIIIRPGISSCSAFDVPVIKRPQPKSSPVCTLSTSYNKTGGFYRIQVDAATGLPTVVPSLEPPWQNCGDYSRYSVNTHDRKQSATDDTVCSQDHLNEIIQRCEESVKPTDSSVSQQFCGSSCKTRVASYAKACNYTEFSLNVTGTCQIDSAQVQCIFAVIIIRAGISSCSANAVNYTHVDNLNDTLPQDTNPSCCSLSTSFNTSGEYFSIASDPITGIPIIQPPLLPPWQNCSAYVSTITNCDTEPTSIIPTVASRNNSDLMSTIITSGSTLSSLQTKHHLVLIIVIITAIVLCINN